MNGASDSEGASRLQHRNLVSAWFNENSIPPPEITVPHCAEIKFMVAGSLLWPQQCFVVGFSFGVFWEWPLFIVLWPFWGDGR